MNTQEYVWKYFLNKGFSPQSIAGIMGNIDEESKFKTNNVEDYKIYLTDEQYTQQVDNGSYKNFVNDGIGYGLVQWTYAPFKQDLLNLCHSCKKSISDLSCQLEQLYLHLQSEGLLNKLKSMQSIAEATEYFMLKFEKPKDQSQSKIDTRIKIAEQYFNQFNKGGQQTMKYSQNNPPLVCMQTNSTCYQQTSQMNVVGILWHSTGANNPNLKRYVQPGENDKNYSSLIAKIGKNPNGNDWNHIHVNAGLNAWIGKLADGSVTTIQTMPWDYRPWGCGSGSKGSCNNGWVQFEICEDGLNDANYFQQVYKEACELTAYICRLYNIGPYRKVNGVPTILCHQDSYKYGMGTNHSDVYHWFNRYGKTMDDVRNDVAALLSNNQSSTTPVLTPTPTTSNDNLARVLKKGKEGNDVKLLQEKLLKLGFDLGPWGADGDFGSSTENAVIQFQKVYKLNIDGEVGPATWNAINQTLNGNIKPTPEQPEAKPIYTGVVIGSASKDENGQYSGGQAGDQTGKEVWTLNWYNQNWTSVIRPKDSTLAEKIASACEKACANNNIGYSQSNRNSLLTQAKKVGFDISKITAPCNCDCSSLVSVCCVCAGLPESIFFPYGNGCTTWTLSDACAKTGKFTEFTDSKYRTQKDYLKRGDILLNRNQHVVIVLSNGSQAESTTPSTNVNKFPYLVKVIVDTLNVRQLPNSEAKVVAQIKRNQVYTIVEEKGGFGKLKSGVGWIDLQYTEKR